MPGRPTKPPAATPTAPTTPAEGELVVPAVADTVIDEVYEEIRGLQRDATIELAVRIGGLIVQRFYGGSLDLVRSHGAKESSLRKLADKFEGDDSGLSAVGIYRVVAIYELDQRVGVSARKQLTVSHARAVLGLPEGHQERLLTKAEEKGWTTRQLEEEVKKVRKKEGDGRGRPVLPTYVKTIHKLAAFLDEKKDAFDGIDDVSDLKEEEATKLYQAVTGMKLKCEELQTALAKRTPGMG